MRQKPNGADFLDTAEKIVRDLASCNPALTVYRGPFQHRSLGAEVEQETIVVGLSDDKDGTKPPTIAVLKIWREALGNVIIDFSIGSDDDTERWIPSSVDAMDDVRELAHRLPTLLR
ncbi:MAG: hypothetical protein AAB804_00315 [Patescibacteria group bacterium]